MRPHIFVGSSTEGAPVAYAIQENLDKDADVVIWNQGVFEPGDYLLESLLRELSRADGGILVLTPDDIVTIRGNRQGAIRDNVLFEFGLFVGKLGRARTFAVTPRVGDGRLPSDLLGVNLLDFDPRRRDQNLAAALGPACNRIRRSLAGAGTRRSAAQAELELPIMDRLDLLSDNQRKLLALFEQNPETSWEQLKGAMPTASGGELHYRLEQLRLLGFVDVVDHQIGYDYAPSVAYQIARDQQGPRVRRTTDRHEGSGRRSTNAWRLSQD